MSESTTVTVEEGARLLQAGDTAGALSTLSQIVAAEPANGKAYGMLGICFAKLGDMEAAISTLQEAARLLPQDVSVRYNLANAMFQAKNVQGARAVAEGVLRLNPGHQNATALLARIAAAAATGRSPSSAPAVSMPVASPASPAAFAPAPQNWNPSAPQPLNQPPGGMPPANWNPGLAPPPQTLAGGHGRAPLGGPSHLGGMALDGAPVAQPIPAANWGPPPSPPGYPQMGGMPAPMPSPGMVPPLPPSSQGMRYTPPAPARQSYVAPGIGLRIARGLLWGALYGQVWTAWRLLRYFMLASTGTSTELIVVIAVLMGLAYSFLGAVAGFIIAVSNSDDGPGAMIGVVAGMLALGLEMLVYRFTFFSILFFFWTGQFIGKSLANRVQGVPNG